MHERMQGILLAGLVGWFQFAGEAQPFVEGGLIFIRCEFRHPVVKRLRQIARHELVRKAFHRGGLFCFGYLAHGLLANTF